MAAFPQIPGFDPGDARSARGRTLRSRKISIALINILLGKNCLVRQLAGDCNFFAERLEVFSAEKGPRKRACATQPMRNAL
jgi:hypothetical protein